MARQERQFAGLRQAPPIEIEAAPPVLQPPRGEVAPKLGRRARGKRSNPLWMSVTLYLKRETKEQADDLLRRDPRDLSEITNTLLEMWISGKVKLQTSESVDG
jgi:hypothetical protein